MRKFFLNILIWILWGLTIIGMWLGMVLMLMAKGVYEIWFMP